MKRIDCFVPSEQVALVFRNEDAVHSVSLCRISQLCDSASMKRIADAASAEYTLLVARETDIRMGAFSLERMLQIADDCSADLVYSDRFTVSGDVVCPAPVIDCQKGSVRDDFEFGALLLFRTSSLKSAAASLSDDFSYAALYRTRLMVQAHGRIEHINEFLYYEVETDNRKSGEKLFDYVNPRNREVQIEMERACTEHLKDIGAYIAPSFRDVDFSSGDESSFMYEATVVIPCRNRVKTIADALKSALSQKTTFKYNVMVVDDNSSDGTVDIIKSFLSDPRLIYIAQDRSWHGIGGNWNAALHHPLCGRFALQLDSDDVYYDENTVQKFVDAFYQQTCAMVVGTYRLTDFDLRTLPPGVIDHKEWTADNGRNNALRINGLGAPRGFWTPILREMNFPPTKYGEDYAVGLRVSREYAIGRIYDVLYNCRRWDDNSDASLPVEKVNANNFYKDKIRTWEIEARQAMNKRNK